MDISIEGTAWTQYSTHPDLLDYASITCHLVWSSASCSNQNCLVSITFEMILKWDLMSRFGIVTYKMVQEPIHHHMSTHRNSLSRPRMPKVDFEKMWQGQFDPPHFHHFHLSPATWSASQKTPPVVALCASSCTWWILKGLPWKEQGFRGKQTTKIESINLYFYPFSM